MVFKHDFSRADCQVLIRSLVDILKKSGLSEGVDFLVYGSYLEQWRDGLSDLDGMLYFSNMSPVHPSLAPKIKIFQSGIRALFQEFPYLTANNYFADIFILDSFFGSDGRFMVYDEEFFRMFWKYTAYQVAHGSLFVDRLYPMSLRNQNELELAIGLHTLRNYLFFEIPLAPDALSMARATGVLKFFKVLPRVTTILLDAPMAKNLDDLMALDRFAHINFTPYIELWDNTSDSASLLRYIRGWHEPDNEAFVRCLQCFEAVLATVVETAPKRGRR